MATYTCERGFELLGPARRVCDKSGQWLPEGIPFCGEFKFQICVAHIILQINRSKLRARAHVFRDAMLYFSVCVYVCVASVSYTHLTLSTIYSV